MALTKISRGLLSTGVSDSSDATAITIDSSERVGIGTSSPAFKLDVNGSLSSNGNENVMRIAGADANNAGGITINAVYGSTAASRVMTLFSIDGQDQASPLAFGNGTTEAMRIDSAGRLMIGTTTEGQADADDLTVANGSGNVGISLRTTTTGFASIYFSDATSGGAEASGAVQYKHDDNYMRFTTAESERMRITSAGDFLHGGTSAFATGVTSLRNRTISSNDFAEVACGGEYATTDTYLVYDTTNSVTRFKVNYQGTVFATSTSISSLSDGRLKENVRELDKGLNDILKLKPVRFDWKAIEGSNKKDITGFIAQECEEAGFEEFVDTYKFNDEIEDAKSFGYSGLIPALVKAIQELEARVKTLEE